MDSLKRLGKTYAEIFENQSAKQIDIMCQALEKERGKFDSAIILLAGELRREQNLPNEEKIKTTLATKIREAAAFIIYKDLTVRSNKKPVIIASGGKIYGYGEETPTLSDVMRNELFEKCQVPREDIKTESYSVDTSQNAEFSAKILKALGFEDDNIEKNNVYLVTNGFHLPRANTLFKRYSQASIKPMNAEDVIINNLKFNKNKEKSQYYEKMIKTFLESPELKKMSQLDKKLLAIINMPFGETMIRALAYYLRSSQEKLEVPLITK